MSTKQKNIEIWEDTIKQCTSGIYKDLPCSQSMISDKLKLTPLPRYEKMTIKVIDMDTLSCCEEYIKQGCNVLGLNMASPRRPGGGVDSGSFSQEENCFRRSNYFKTLDQSFYPLSETSCIYSPSITVIKDKNYQLLKTPFNVAMIACAALRSPPLLKNGQYVRNRDHEMMKYKIEQIFQVGYQMGHDTLILGAFGCGAFRNNPEVVADIFNEVINKYKLCFKNIIFAVMSYHDKNYEIFSQKIKQT